jgi:hypothetical protein
VHPMADNKKDAGDGGTQKKDTGTKSGSKQRK